MKAENPFGVLYHLRSKIDADSKFIDSSNQLFQGKKLAPCKGLTAWVRWGNLLFRWYEVFWWLGYEGDKYRILTADELHQLANQYIGEQPIPRLLKKVDNWQIQNKQAYFHARCNKLSRASVDNFRLIPKSLTINHK